MSRVYGHVRLLAGILLLTAGAASAETIESTETRGVHPYPRFAAGLALLIHAGAIHGVAAAGVGPNVELALGVGRTQYFVEGTYGWGSVGLHEHAETGSFARGAAGIRWIARSLDIENSAAVEMTLEALAGAHQYRIDGESLARPELGAGVALQLRKYRGPRFAARFTLRAFWAPVDDDSAIVARGSAVPATAPTTNGGLMVSIGASH